MIELKLASRGYNNSNDTPDSEPCRLSDDEPLLFSRAFPFDFAGSNGRGELSMRSMY